MFNRPVQFPDDLLRALKIVVNGHVRLGQGRWQANPARPRSRNRRAPSKSIRINWPGGAVCVAI
jgi:hypothetical protein